MTEILFEHHHLSIEAREDGQVLFSQMDFAGEEARIMIHRDQIRLVAERVGLIARAPVPMPMVAPIAGGDAMQHLAVDVAEDGTVIISQTQVRSMGGSDNEIELHPIQVSWLAAKLSELFGVQVVGATETAPEAAARHDLEVGYE